MNRVADALGTGDGPRSPVEWLPDQRRHPTYAVQIAIAWALPVTPSPGEGVKAETAGG